MQPEHLKDQDELLLSEGKGSDYLRQNLCVTENNTANMVLHTAKAQTAQEKASIT